jgi:hypothetical protein
MTKKYNPIKRLNFVLIASICIGEALIMFILPSFEGLSHLDSVVLDVLLLSLIMASKSNRSIRKYFRSKILPPLRDEVKKMPSEGLFAFLVELRRKKTYF